MTYLDIEPRALDIDKALGVLNLDGPFSKILKGFEPREQQKSMMRNIIEAFNQDAIALVEAGTGTGKSLAYLVPAILWAAQFKERTVISTNTIPLQEQLLNKDIPLISKALNVEIKAALVKGMHNYLCLRKLDDALQESLLLPSTEQVELQKIDVWKETRRHDGSRSALPFSPSHATWERVAAESDTCSRGDCPCYQECLFFKARRQANDAQILVVNHHMLFADLVFRAENGPDQGLIPNYSRVIIDEAHNIEDIATEYFAEQISLMNILKVMARLAADKGGKHYGKLPFLKEKLLHQFSKEMNHDVTSLYNRLTFDLPGLRRDLLQIAHETFESYQKFVKVSQPSEDSGELKLRLLPKHLANPHWKEIIVPHNKKLAEALNKYAQALNSLENDFKRLDNNTLQEQIKGVLFDINALANRLKMFSATLTIFSNGEIPPARVRWMESQTLKTMTNTTLVDADLDISNKLVEYLFKKFSTVILCSATLTTNKKFDFVRARLGLNSSAMKDRLISENIYDSPFNFQTQAMLAIPTDLPSPLEESFIPTAAEKVWQMIQASRGNAFILFTSYSMLKVVFERLEKRLKDNRFNALKQGDDERQALLNRFKNTERSVLFGTDSFWEGIDVVGDALRCVIIVKLPFKVPSDPLIQARSEAILSNGGDPFMHYSLPQAIVKFKQGFGRLIRNRRDRGCIVVLDHRIITKRYGKLFLNSLPICQQISAPSSVIQEKMSEFYRKTNYLVVGN